jgi:hypothetical protein
MSAFFSPRYLGWLEAEARAHEVERKQRRATISPRRSYEEDPGQDDMPPSDREAWKGFKKKPAVK